MVDHQSSPYQEEAPASQTLELQCDKSNNERIAL